MDAARIYAEAQERLLALAAGPAGEAAETPVPALPAWNVRQTYAHLAGICVDVVAGTVTPPATDEITARQVAEREGQDIEQICQEWRSNTPALLELLDSGTRMRHRLPVVDVWTHENDLRGALGMPAQTRDADQLLDFALSGAARMWPEHLPSVTATATDLDRSWTLGGGTGLQWRGTAYELHRALMGRRTPGQVAAMDWTGDPAPVLGALALLPAAERPLDV
ncbi:maleylpyruvate isomerase N-terminal domain-containing protein [Nocardiopsis algeriensis]|uniref:maleylpyruvate isomerase N-terminal domain-containing protein n=1 Tax=Nocardiopsis algeriensis TaxID=1478215 RepID=UPI003B43AC37